MSNFQEGSKFCPNSDRLASLIKLQNVGQNVVEKIGMFCDMFEFEAVITCINLVDLENSIKLVRRLNGCSQLHIERLASI